MRKGNKKIWVILLMAVFIVIFISIMAALYLHNDTKSIKNIEESSDYVTDDKNEKEYNDLENKESLSEEVKESEDVNNHQEFNENFMDISLNEARVILDNAYPDYSFLEGGEVGQVFNSNKGIEETAYCVRYKKNGTNDVYVGFVFSDKTFSFNFLGR